MAQRFASRLALFLIAIFAALPVCLLASASSARAAGHAAKTRIARAVKSPVAKHRISHPNALPFTSVKALAARIEDMKAAAEKKKLDDEAAGTDFLESILYFIRQRAFPKDSIDLSAYARGVAQRDRLAPARIGQGQIIANTFIPSNQPRHPLQHILWQRPPERARQRSRLRSRHAQDVLSRGWRGRRLEDDRWRHDLDTA
jgi:hypothetical protein